MVRKDPGSGDLRRETARDARRPSRAGRLPAVRRPSRWVLESERGSWPAAGIVRLSDPAIRVHPSDSWKNETGSGGNEILTHSATSCPMDSVCSAGHSCRDHGAVDRTRKNPPGRSGWRGEARASAVAGLWPDKSSLAHGRVSAPAIAVTRGRRRGGGVPAQRRDGRGNGAGVRRSSGASAPSTPGDARPAGAGAGRLWG